MAFVIHEREAGIYWKLIIKAVSLGIIIKAMEQIFDRIAIDEGICNGKPTIKGTRITVQTIIEFLSAGDSEEEILSSYPTLKQEDIKAALKFAASIMDRLYVTKSVA